MLCNPNHKTTQLTEGRDWGGGGNIFCILFYFSVCLLLLLLLFETESNRVRVALTDLEITM